MDLEKRALLAFVLSMLLFLGFYWYYSPVLEQRASSYGVRDTLGDTLAARDAGEVPADSVLPGGEPVAELPIPPERAPKVIVDSDLYRATLSCLGGGIVSVRLKKYKTLGQPVELLAPDSLFRGAAGVELVGEERAIALTSFLFDAYMPGQSVSLPDSAVLALGPSRPSLELIFHGRDGRGREIERYYRFRAGSYLIETGLRYTQAQFPFARRIAWDLGGGMAIIERKPSEDLTNMKASVRLGEEIHHLKPGHFSKKRRERYSGTVVWASLQTKYFMAALIPPVPTAGEVEVRGEKAESKLSAAVELPAETRAGEVNQEIKLYFGPLDFKLLKSLGLGMEKNINMGYKLLRPLSWVILKTMIGLYKVIPNYGLVIIILSIFTKVLFYRLTHKSFKSMREMQALQPKLQALKEKYKDDRQKLNVETMKIYREAGVNPLGGCLPMLLQAPVFIALFNVLKYTIELRGAGFVGWIDDLSQQDVLFLLPLSLPLIGNQVSVLPLLMGAAMVLQTKIGGSVTGGASSSAQPKALNYMLPVVFTILFYRMPSGLVLYWLVNNILSIGQQYYINKDIKREESEKKTVKKTARKARTQRGKVMHR